MEDSNGGLAPERPPLLSASPDTTSSYPPAIPWHPTTTTPTSSGRSPIFSEQRAIVSHIATETAKLDALRASAERIIRLLKERRSAVTGKIAIPESKA